MRNHRTIYITSLAFVLLSFGVWISCTRQAGDNNKARVPGSITDEQLLDTIQLRTFQYFWDGAEPVSGMARERFHMDGVYPQDDKHIVTSGGGGFGLMALVVGMERGFISREEGVTRLQRIIGFLENSDRFHGAWPHWLNGETGEVKPFSKKDNGGDLAETSYLVQGLLTVRPYLNSGDGVEAELRDRITKLCDGVEWGWYQKGGEPVLYWHWSPQYEWEMNHHIRGYNECMITYVLGASSNTHPISEDTYHTGWARDGMISGENKKYDLLLDLNHNGAKEYGGPLFWSHYSYLGLDPRNLKDDYSDYWQHNVNHTLIDYFHCVENPHSHKGYGENCWGLSASYSLNGYSAHSPARDLGVISPTAALSSFPYTPEESMKAARFFYDSLGTKLLGPYGFYDAFSMEEDWFPQRYLAIDQGPIVVMIENYRTGLLWDLFMSNEEVQKGLIKLGFSYE
ncbi:MAG: beta-glucosidase [Bacteroidales bacterium]|nr:beta-glucosidase [Bacteroidales bacterium]